MSARFKKSQKKETEENETRWLTMEFINELKELSKNAALRKEALHTEEATKTALIMPFIRTLGYDIFNPNEVIPEYVADVGIKKGEKVDYAVMKDGDVIMIFECKHCGSELSIDHASQLFRYFSVTDSRIAVLTNGLTYQFFTDLDARHKMDEKPFLVVDLLNLKESDIKELRKLSKQSFDIEQLMNRAGELKYTRQIKKLLEDQLEKPSEEFVKFVASQVFDGMLSPNRREYFSSLAKRGFNQLINDRINERFQSAMSGSEDAEVSLEDLTVDTEEIESKEKRGVVTTEEELEGFFIVKALLRGKVDPSRIVHRDTQSYMGILLDDNNRKPLARLHFNTGQKYLGVFDEDREETRIAIDSLDDIYDHADELNRVFDFYEREEEETQTQERGASS